MMKRLIFAVFLYFLIISTTFADKIDHLVEHKSSIRRLGAITVITQDCVGSERVRQLSRLTGDTSVKIRTKAIVELGKSRCYDAVPVLKKLQQTEQSGAVRVVIATALKTLGPLPDHIVKKNKADAKQEAVFRANFAKYKDHNSKIKTEVSNFMMSYTQYLDGSELGMFQQACAQVMNLETTYKILRDKNHEEHKVIVRMVREVIPMLASDIATIFRVTRVGDVVCYIPGEGLATVDSLWTAVLSVK